MGCPCKIYNRMIPPEGSRNPEIYIVGEAPGCISGDTYIEVAFRDVSRYPKGIPIKQLVGKNNFYVYSFDISNECIDLGKVKKVWKTGTKKTYKVTYEWWGFSTNGKRKRYRESIIVTENHKFLLRKKILGKRDPLISKNDNYEYEYKSLSTGLEIGHSLLPFLRYISTRGKNRGKFTCIGYNHTNIITEHIFLMEKISGMSLGKPYNIHHINENSLDNRFENLQILTVAEHAKLHYKSNPLDDPKIKAKHLKTLHSEEYRNKLSKIMREKLKQDEELYKKRAKQIIEAGKNTRFKKGELNPIIYYKQLLSYVRRGIRDLEWVKYRFETKFPNIPFPPIDNHIITSIEPFGIIDVYDMEVEKYHNFAANGIFIHNSMENIEGVPFIGESGQLLRTAMRIVNKAIGRKFRYRINNSCLCSPKDKEGNIRTPTFAESMNCSRIHLYSDIAKHPPSKGIITLGKLAISVILGENIKSMKQCIGSVYEFHGIKVYPFYHPSYIKRNGGTSSLLFKKLIDHIEEVLTGKKQITKISTEVKLNYEYIVVKDEEVDKIFEEEILNKKYICLDIETNGLAYKLNHIKTRCIGIAVDKRKAYVFLPSEKVNKNLDKLFRSETKILGQNIGFDIGFLCYKNGYKWPKVLTDTMLAGYLLNENQRRYNLLELYRRYLPEFVKYKKEAEGNVLHMNDKQLYEYNAADCIGELRLAEKLYKKLRKEKLLWLHDNIMIPALKVIYRKEQRGVRFDVPYMKKLDTFLAKKQRVIERNIRSQPDFIEFRKRYKTVKLTSPIDIRNFFIEFKKYPVVSTSKKTKFPTMDVKTLEYYANNLDCNIAKLLLKLRKIQKARSTYLSGLIPKLIGDIGYPTYNLTRTATGRLSSGGKTKGIDTNKAKIKLFQDDIAISDFNIQNIPSRDKTLKNIVIAREGKVLIAADYDTSEIKCAAAYSKCPAMREFCNDKKKDFHTLVASEVFKVPYNEVSKELRTIAKSISFGVLYGMTKEGLALRLGISVDEAERYINEYFERMPEVKEAIDGAIDNVRKYGYVVNPFGRRRRFEYLNAEVEREAFNAIIQSFSSDLLLFALIKLDSLCEREDPETEPIYPLIDVHDSIVVEAYDHPATIEEAIEMITYSMVKYPLENRVVRKALWGVRPSIDIKIGYKWGDMIDYKEFMQKYC